MRLGRTICLNMRINSSYMYAGTWHMAVWEVYVQVIFYARLSLWGVFCVQTCCVWELSRGSLTGRLTGYSGNYDGAGGFIHILHHFLSHAAACRLCTVSTGKLRVVDVQKAVLSALIRLAIQDVDWSMWRLSWVCSCFSTACCCALQGASKVVPGQVVS